MENQHDVDFEDLERYELDAALSLHRHLTSSSSPPLVPTKTIALTVSEQSHQGAGVYGFLRWEVLCHDLPSLRLLHEKMLASEQRRDMRLCPVLEEILTNAEDGEGRRERRKRKRERRSGGGGGGGGGGDAQTRKSSRQLLLESKRMAEEEEQKRRQLERRIEQEEKRLKRSEERRRMDHYRKKIQSHSESMVSFEMPQELYALQHLTASRTSSSSSSLQFHQSQRLKNMWYSAMSVMRRCLHEDVQGWFYRPVPRSLAPDYLQRVAIPMDLGTVFCKLLLHEYDDNTSSSNSNSSSSNSNSTSSSNSTSNSTAGYEQFVRDMNLVWSNACEYNGEDAPVSNEALRLKRIFDEGWTTLVSEGGGGGVVAVEGIVVAEPKEEKEEEEKEEKEEMTSSAPGVSSSHQIVADEGSVPILPKSLLNSKVEEGRMDGHDYFARSQWLEHFECIIQYVRRPTAEGDFLYDMGFLPINFTNSLEHLFSKVSSRKQDEL